MFGLKAFLAYFSRVPTGDAILTSPYPLLPAKPGEVKIHPSGGGKRGEQAGKGAFAVNFTSGGILH